MKLRYTDFESCPIVIEVTLGDLDKLITLAKDSSGPFRVLTRELIEARTKALEDAAFRVKYEIDRAQTPSA